MMQLDQTHVAIRVRTLSEIGDLSLLMIRRYPLAFFQCFFLGAAPWVFLNAIALSGIVWQYSGDSNFDSDAVADYWRYILMMTTLVVVQTPVAGAFSTHYLGQAVFEQEQTLKQTFTDVFSIWMPLVWVLGVRRLAIPLTIYALLRRSESFDGFYDVFVPISVLLFLGLLRGLRPFVPEMIVLERCPLRDRKTASTITLRKRSGALHSPMSSDLGGRFLTVAFIFLLLSSGIFYSLMFARGVSFGLWSADAIAMLILFPLSLWLVASLSVIVRLLGYLDTRIRLEGWEVELALRAEAMRQFGSDSMSSNEGSLAPPKKTTRQSAVIPSVTTTVLALCLIQPVNAEQPSKNLEEAPPVTVAGSVWFDAKEQVLRPVNVVDETPLASHRESRWTKKPSKKAGATRAASGWRSWGIWDLPWGQVFAWTVLIVLVSSLVATLAWVFRNTEFDFAGSKRSIGATAVVDGIDEQTQQRIAELPAELRPTGGHPRADAERFMNVGNFDAAIISLFSHQLLLLDRTGWLRLARGKTNRRYVSETRSSDHASARILRETVESFERSFFGRHAISKEQFSELWRLNTELESLVSTSIGNAA